MLFQSSMMVSPVPRMRLLAVSALLLAPSTTWNSLVVDVPVCYTMSSCPRTKLSDKQMVQFTATGSSLLRRM